MVVAFTHTHQILSSMEFVLSRPPNGQQNPKPPPSPNSHVTLLQPSVLPKALSSLHGAILHGDSPFPFHPSLDHFMPLFPLLIQSN